jgi:ABC-type branched-subunit amino acid transport system ATPase component
MAVGVAAAAIAAALIGAVIVRRRGVYFAMVTIAFGQVFYFIAFRWNTVTGGDDGLTGWHRMPIDLGFTQLDIYGEDKAFYYFALAIFAVCVGIMALLLASPYGRTLLAIRENERRARFLGIPIERHIWLSFVISCVFVSVAGSLYALLNNFTDPRALRFDQSGNFVIMAVLGGMRSFWGPLIGAGKTTFFNLISGFFAPTSGAIKLEDEDISALSPEARVARGMARTFQVTEVFPELGVGDNLRIAVEVAAGYGLRPWIGRVARRQVDDRVAGLLGLAGLTAKRHLRVGALSHGDQRATEIMMSLALRPRLLMLDEPTAGMGDQETFEISRLIRRLHRQEGLTIMLIEHDMRVVFNLADRIMVLAEGKVLAEGAPEDIARSEAVQAAYLGKAAA